MTDTDMNLDDFDDADPNSTGVDDAVADDLAGDVTVEDEVVDYSDLDAGDQADHTIVRDELGDAPTGDPVDLWDPEAEPATARTDEVRFGSNYSGYETDMKVGSGDEVKSDSAGNLYNARTGADVGKYDSNVYKDK